jgi:hypothetical protein
MFGLGIINEIFSCIYCFLLAKSYAKFSCLHSMQGSGKNETIRDFARVCGQPFYPFACATKMDPMFLTGVFKGLAMTGWCRNLSLTLNLFI